ncbi:MAG: phosphotransferase [Chlorobi bacterium]|nr:phosphotransferase [Chlorobiota bacterium]
MSTIDRLSELFNDTFGTSPLSIATLRADGSNRELYRLTGSENRTFIGVYGPDAAENRAFVAFSHVLLHAKLPVPQIYAQNEEYHIYIEEDLGNKTLYDALSEEGSGEQFPQTIIPLYRAVVEILPCFQVVGGQAVDFSLSIPRAEFDRRSMLWDLHYFKYMFLKLTGVQFDEEQLEEDFERLVDFLLQAPIEHFLYRDFQSRNIMLRGESLATAEPWFIDYQGGRRGALQYDIASLLYDAKANIPDDIRKELLELYLDALTHHIEINRKEFLKLFPGFVLIRALQAMGAYGYRGLYERKEHFIASIPYAIQNVLNLLDNDFPIELPELVETFEWLTRTSDYSLKEAGTVPFVYPENNRVDSHPLKVHITSFSYKRGSYPVDETEHGGGYVFDCRPLHNPGRYPEYADKTGKDEDVVRFLEGRDDVEGLWQNVSSIVEAAVTRYQERKFDYLSVAFGCTGGQHRSVYFAERLAGHLRQGFRSITITIDHREQEGI